MECTLIWENWHLLLSVMWSLPLNNQHWDLGWGLVCPSLTLTGPAGCLVDSRYSHPACCVTSRPTRGSHICREAAMLGAALSIGYTEKKHVSPRDEPVM